MKYHYDFSGFKTMTFERLLKDCMDPRSIWIFFEDMQFGLNSRVGFIDNLTMKCEKRYLSSQEKVEKGHYDLLRQNLYHFAKTQGFIFAMDSFYFDDLLDSFIDKIGFPETFYSEDLVAHFEEFLAFLSPYLENITNNRFYESLDIPDVNSPQLLEGATP